jgi:hypothetical protein
MHGFVWKDQRGIEGVGFVRALRTLLTSKLPDLLPNLKSSIKDQFQAELKKCKLVNGEHSICIPMIVYWGLFLT